MGVKQNLIISLHPLEVNKIFSLRKIVSDKETEYSQEENLNQSEGEGVKYLSKKTKKRSRKTSLRKSPVYSKESNINDILAKVLINL